MTATVNERLVDLYFERAIDLIRLEAGMRQKVLTLLQDLESEIVATIAKTNPNNKRLAKLLKAVKAAITASYRGVNVLMAEEVRELIDVEATWTARAINSAMQIEFIDAGLTRGQLSTLVSEVLIQGAPTKEWWARQAGGLAERFADEMRRGVALGENNAKLIERVRGKSGLMNIAESSASRLVRSSVQTAANVGREAVYAENNDIISAIQWSATLDTRTSEWCLVRDGKLYSPIEHKPIGHDIPWLEGAGKIHWGCRSTSVPVLKTWRELGIDEDEIPKTTRASMDGQVAQDTTFESWLKKQSIERQDASLGKEKAALWRAGKITLRDLLDQDGRPLTLEQLKARL